MFNELHILTDSAYRLAGIAQLLPASRSKIGKQDRQTKKLRVIYESFSSQIGDAFHTFW
jgi:hypothetical protein